MTVRRLIAAVAIAVCLSADGNAQTYLRNLLGKSPEQISDVTPYTLVDGVFLGPFMDSTFFFNRLGTPLYNITASFQLRGLTPNDYGGDSWTSAKIGLRPKGILWIPATYPNDSTITFSSADSAVTALDFRSGKFSVVGNSPQLRVGLASPLGLTGGISNITGSIVTASNIVAATTTNNTGYLSMGMSGASGDAVFDVSRTGSGTTPSYLWKNIGTTRMQLYPSGSLVVGSATGGDQGAGNVNAKGFYDDGVLLTGGQNLGVFLPSEYSNSWQLARNAARPKGILWIPPTYADSSISASKPDTTVVGLGFRRGVFRLTGYPPKLALTRGDAGDRVSLELFTIDEFISGDVPAYSSSGDGSYISATRLTSGGTYFPLILRTSDKNHFLMRATGDIVAGDSLNIYRSYREPIYISGTQHNPTLRIVNTRTDKNTSIALLNTTSTAAGLGNDHEWTVGVQGTNTLSGESVSEDNARQFYIGFRANPNDGSLGGYGRIKMMQIDTTQSTQVFTFGSANSTDPTKVILRGYRDFTAASDDEGNLVISPPTAKGTAGNGSLIFTTSKDTTGGIFRRQVERVAIVGGIGPTTAMTKDSTLSVHGGGHFSGGLDVDGNLTKGGGSFKIDHPLDPENKYLSHSFVESPDMMNIYNGIAKLNEKGEAIVVLPDWFEALNKDFRYQLTCIGTFAPVYIAAGISSNHFKIAGGSQDLSVSWQVTGIRRDAYADKHRIAVEEEKPADEKGKYLHPDAFARR